MKRIFCMLTVLLMLTGCAAPEQEPTETLVEIVQLANPWADYETLAEAEAAVGFSLNMPESLDTFQAEEFRVLNGHLLEVTYRAKDFWVVVRKALGSGQDISGVIGEMEKQTVLVYGGRDIITQYYGEAVLDAIFSPEETVTIYASQGYPDQTRYDFLSALLKAESWLIQVNEAFNAQISENGSHRASDLSNFFSCTYDAPEEIDLAAFLQYNALRQQVEDGTEVAEVIKAATDEYAFAVTPVWRYPKEAVSQLLKTYAGITVDDLNSQEGVLYLEEFDAYYNFTSDWGPGKFFCTGGKQAGDTVTLWSDTHTLTLREVNGSYQIVSHQERAQ